MKAWSYFLFGLVTLSTVTAQELPPTIFSTVEQIQEDFQNVPCNAKDRQAGVRALFSKLGAEPDALKVDKVGRIENVRLEIAGTSKEKIVIGAHYDFVDRGCGAVDNWTGIVALAHLYRSIQVSPKQKTVEFVAFGREEEGLQGSRAMVNGIPKDQLASYCAMINMDSFGLAQPMAMENTSSRKLMALAKASAESVQIPFYTVPINAGDADSSSFLGRNIPAITLSGLSDEWQQILHSPQDKASKVIPYSVYLGYRLALEMWTKLDAEPCSAYR